jgi:hypothetical protein
LQVPLTLCHAIARNADRSLVRLRCMVLDNGYQNEIFPLMAHHTDKLSGEKRWVSTLFQDSLPSLDDGHSWDSSSFADK